MACAEDNICDGMKPKNEKGLKAEDCKENGGDNAGSQTSQKHNKNGENHASSFMDSGYFLAVMILIGILGVNFAGQ